MKTFNTTPVGGLRFFSDDLRFMMDISRESIEAIMKPLSDVAKVIILKGCEVTDDGTTTFVSEGIIYMKNQVMRFEPQSFPTPVGSQLAYWIDETIVLETRNFQAGNSVDVYQETVAKIAVSTSLPPYSTLLNSTKTYWDVVNQKVVHPVRYESYYHTDFAEFASRLYSIGGVFGFAKQLRVDHDGFTELNAVNDTTTIDLVALTASSLGRVYRLRFDQPPSGVFNFRLMLNSTSADSSVAFRKKGVVSDDVELTPLPIGETLTFIQTKQGWELLE